MHEISSDPPLKDRHIFVPWQGFSYAYPTSRLRFPLDLVSAEFLLAVSKKFDLFFGQSSILIVGFYCCSGARNPQFHNRTKHIDIRRHFVREVKSKGGIKLTYVPTDLMVADSLTKPLSAIKFRWFTELIGLRKGGGEMGGKWPTSEG